MTIQGPDITGAVTGAFLLGLGIPLLLWVVEAVLVGWLANAKGRDMFAWFFLALLLGPVALLAVGFAPRGTATRYGECPYCREPIPLKAVRCPVCHEELGSDGEREENPYLTR